MDNHKGIGKNGKIPWNLPVDRAWFRAHTDGGVLIMGRKTWDSLPRPLDNRTNVILSSKAVPGYWTFSSMLDALKFAKSSSKPIWIIGGRKVYEEALYWEGPKVLYITRIDGTFGCDTFFPDVPEGFKDYIIFPHLSDGQFNFQFKVMKSEN